MSILGLGKTVQTLGFLSLLRNTVPSQLCLILCPLTVIQTWSHEVEGYWPSCKMVVYTGTKDERKVLRKKMGLGHVQLGHDGKHENENEDNEYIVNDCSSGLKNEGPEQHKFDLIIMSYETFMCDVKILLRLNWSCLVVDEAHRLKSCESVLYKLLINSVIRESSIFKILLTGTPLQNNINVSFNNLKNINFNIL